MDQKRRLLLIGALALAVGALLSLYVYNHLKSGGAQSRTDVDVVIAATDIQVGMFRLSPKLTPNDGAPTVRVLVVEDYAPFRQYIASILAQTDDLRVICEASDGLEAVHKAEELKPDLILLDIELPTLNGIEAARQIRQLCPESKIIFVSQESDADIVQEALSFGGLGYVVKTMAGGELLTAIKVVCGGRLFVGGGLSSRYCSC